jgi:hypothetical protein
VEEKTDELFDEHPNISVRDAAAQIGIPKSTMSDLKLHKLGYKARKSIDAPKYKPGQAIRAKKVCRKIYRKLLLKKKGSILVIDDESYAPADPEQIPGDQYYHEKPGKPFPVEHKIKRKE